MACQCPGRAIAPPDTWRFPPCVQGGAVQMTTSGSALSDWRGHANRLLPSLAAGVVIALSAAFTGIGVAALAFPAGLQTHMPAAIATVLFSAAVLSAVTGLLSSRPGVISLPQEAPAAITGLMAGSVAVTLPSSLPQDERFLMLILAMGLATVTTGLAFFLLGYFRVGGMIRFIPYPVVGGMLASLGWLMFQGGASVASGVSPELSNLGALMHSSTILQIGAGLIVGIVLVLLIPRIRHYLALPGLLVLHILIFYLVAWLAGAAPAELLDSGWLLGPFPDGIGWAPPDWPSIIASDHIRLVELLPAIGTLVFVSTVSLLLYATGTELIVRSDADLDRDLRANGLANILSGAGGGFTGFHSISDTLLAREMGALTRLTALTTSLMLLVVLFSGFDLLAYFPRAVVAGMLFYLGYLLLHDWVVKARRMLPIADYAIIICMVLVAASFGYLEAIGLGLIAGIGLFVATYSQLDVTKFEATGAVMRSNVDRPTEERRCLDTHGSRIFVMSLQGFLFFGTAHSVFVKIRDRCLQQEQPPAFVVLDFRLVTGLDSSSVTTFRKLRHLAEDHGFRICLTGVSEPDQEILIKSGVASPDTGVLYFRSDLDHGLEDCEEAVLETVMTQREDEASLSALPEWLMQRVSPYLESVDCPRDACIIRQGDASDDMFFVRRGRVTVRFDAGEAGQSKRLRSYGPGTVVGEAAMYLGQPRSASIYAETDVQLLKMERDALTRMTREDPATAAEFHKFVAKLLSDRMMATNMLVQALL